MSRFIRSGLVALAGLGGGAAAADQITFDFALPAGGSPTFNTLLSASQGGLGLQITGTSGGSSAFVTQSADGLGVVAFVPGKAFELDGVSTTESLLFEFSHDVQVYGLAFRFVEPGDEAQLSVGGAVAPEFAVSNGTVQFDLLGAGFSAAQLTGASFRLSTTDADDDFSVKSMTVLYGPVLDVGTVPDGVVTVPTPLAAPAGAALLGAVFVYRLRRGRTSDAID